MGGKSEFSLVTITAVMHHYLDNRWVIVGPSRIGIYHDTEANSFRIVARKIDEYEVVANCAINETFCYDQSTPSFHQWRDSSKVYGVKFGCTEDSTLFADTVRRIVLAFNQVHKLIESTNTAMELSNGGPVTEKFSAQTSNVDYTSAGHVQDIVSASVIATNAPVNEPVSSFCTGRGIKPVPPPPPPPQNVKPTNPSAATNFNGNNKAVERASQPKPGPSFLNEMELTLARRRAKIDALDETDRGVEEKDRKESVQSRDNSNASSMNGFERKWSLPATSTNHQALSNGNQHQAGSSALDKLKEEILCEMREELLLFKKDLIEAIKEQLSTAHRQ